MKRFILICLILFVFSIGTADEQYAITESLTPASAILFAKSSKVNVLVKKINYIINNVVTKKQKQTVITERNQFKEKTGIDPLDSESLKAAGFDIDNTIGFAYLKKIKKQERMLIFVPVLNEKTFPLKFVEIIKNFNKGVPNIDAYPVITEYNKKKIYQIQKDIFSTSMSGYFILAPTGELIKEVIDAGDNKKKAFNSNPMYNDYLKNVKQDFDLKIFAKRDFLIQIFESGMKRMRQTDKKAGVTQTTSKYRSFEVKYSEKNGLKPSNSKDAVKSSGGAALDAVEYASLGIGLKSNIIKLGLASNFNLKSPLITSILRMIKTGMTGRALYAENMALYSYLSVDFNNIEKMCKNPGPVSVYYNGFKEKINKELGIDFSRDFIPYYSGAVNVVLGKTKEIGKNNYAVFLPMNNILKSNGLWKKVRSNLKKKYKTGKRFGDTNIGGNKSFWYLNDKNEKNHILVDKRGIYVGNDIDLLKSTLKSKEIKDAGAKDLLLKKMVNNIFFLAYVSKDSFINNLMKMQAQRSKELGRAAASVGDIYITGGKDGNLISIDLDIEIIKK